jgi:hypothetical protein
VKSRGRSIAQTLDKGSEPGKARGEADVVSKLAASTSRRAGDTATLGRGRTGAGGLALGDRLPSGWSTRKSCHLGGVAAVADEPPFSEKPPSVASACGFRV